MLCPDCVKCLADLDKAGIVYDYLDFADNLGNLKEFLILREQPVFDAIRKEGKIGIPCIQKEDGKILFDWMELM